MRKFLFVLIFSSLLLPAKMRDFTLPEGNLLGRINEYAYPTNPMNNRAKGYILKGKVKSAITNYGAFITWDEHPAGAWGNYTYLPDVGFFAGVSGKTYSHLFAWDLIETINGGDVAIWASEEAYAAWFPDMHNGQCDSIWYHHPDDNDNCNGEYAAVVFYPEDDRGDIDAPVLGYQFNESEEWGFDHETGEILISLPNSEQFNPNQSVCNVVLARPYSVRPRLSERLDAFDMYDYGPDAEEWTEDDDYMYYGATVSESYLSRLNPANNTDWQPAAKSRENTHNMDYTAGDLFGDTWVTDGTDTYPVLAHSNMAETWPTRYNEEIADWEYFWPGWFAENYWGDQPEMWPDLGITDCTGKRKDENCWTVDSTRFISDTDVYMEFDDTWAHRGNRVDSNNEYEQTGYPMGLTVRAMAHSYGVAYAEDIMFVTVKVRNESGDFAAFTRDRNGNKVPVLDEYGVQITGDGTVMPDGTKLNRGEGFDYHDISMGFYMDSDVLTADLNGSFWPHTNNDDFMEYFWEKFYLKGDSLIISLAMVYDYDGESSGAPRIGESDLGVVGVQLLDSPYATEEVDLDLDGITDIYVGEKLKMTDWHWFDWYNRPGVVTRETDNNCCCGDRGRPCARNKEEIQYKVIIGDTTNISLDEKSWFFHTADPDTDADVELNPHFDSLEGLHIVAEREDPTGVDAVLQMSCGPFSLEVGEEVPFSFCVIFGEARRIADGGLDLTDLKTNARFAQIMYNSRYQGFTPPAVPKVYTESEHNKVTVYWTDAAENSSDVVTNYSDFEGYKLYKSTDLGETWGPPDSIITNNAGVFQGWRPLKQWDMTAEDDSLECIFQDCEGDHIRGMSVSGPDPITPWFNLGSDSGFDDVRLPEPVEIDGDFYAYAFVDTNVVDGFEYTYSVTAYDMGVPADYMVRYVEQDDGFFTQDTVYSTANPDHWASPAGYQMIENSKGTTQQDANFSVIEPGYPATEHLEEVIVVPNPYIVNSGFNETEYQRKIRFTNLPTNCTITIFTVTGEKVYSFEHIHPMDGNEWWDLRTINNQEVAPGLYFFAVETDNGDKFLGKFSIVR